MKASLAPFEEYVVSLTKLGVYPTLSRNYNGWVCVLRNGVNTQIMPVDDEECWGETMLDALTVAVARLNSQFSSAEDLHKYINTGICEDVEALLENIESLHQVKTPATGGADKNDLNDETVLSDALH